MDLATLGHFWNWYETLHLVPQIAIFIFALIGMGLVYRAVMFLLALSVMAFAGACIVIDAMLK